MNRDDLETVMRLLAGHWPQPEMGEDEAAVWARTLMPLDIETVVEAIEDLSRSGRMHFRPTDGEVYRTCLNLRHSRPKPPALEEGAVVPPEAAKANVETLRGMVRGIGRRVAAANVVAGPLPEIADPTTAQYREIADQMRAERLAKEAAEREAEGA